MKIGVFDSGRGGEAVAHKLQQLLPNAKIISCNDSKNVPYGGRSQKEIIALTSAAIQPLIQAHCDAIVIACNTATVNAIQSLRESYPLEHFIGLEPMVKPAAVLTKTKKIAVLATPATLASESYKKLKSDYADGVVIREPDCATWAALIEAGHEDTIPVAETITPLVADGVDVIVLACTHYHWLESAIETIVGPDITILEPTDAIHSRIVEITQPLH